MPVLGQQCLGIDTLFVHMSNSLEGLELAKVCAQVADDVQAQDIRVLDLRGLSSLTDFMIVCTCLLYTSDAADD